MAEAEIKELCTHFMGTYLKRIDATNPSKNNTPENKTNNTIILVLTARILTIQVRGAVGDNKVWIDICSLDNQYYVLYNKPFL